MAFLLKPLVAYCLLCILGYIFGKTCNTIIFAAQPLKQTSVTYDMFAGMSYVNNVNPKMPP